jgi:hypothetical protein
MGKPVGVFKPETAAMVLEVIEYLRTAGYLTRKGQSGNPLPPSNIGYIFKTPVGGIAGRNDNDELQFAECEPFYIGINSKLTPLLDNEGNTQTMPVGHLGREPVEGETYIQAKWSYGHFLADMEDCFSGVEPVSSKTGGGAGGAASQSYGDGVTI